MDQDTDTQDTDDTDEDEGNPCGGTPPEITGFTVTPDGTYEFEEGEQAVVKVQMDIYDDDGDIHWITYKLWWEADPDGEVDTSRAASYSSSNTQSSAPCDTFNTGLSLTLGVGGSLAHNTWYDWALVVGDAEGLESEPVVTIGGTPKSDGSDPDPLPDPDTGAPDTGAPDTGAPDTGQ